jgi:hypothetical protein
MLSPTTVRGYAGSVDKFCPYFPSSLLYCRENTEGQLGMIFWLGERADLANLAMMTKTPYLLKTPMCARSTRLARIGDVINVTG